MVFMIFPWIALKIASNWRRLSHQHRFHQFGQVLLEIVLDLRIYRLPSILMSARSQLLEDA